MINKALAYALGVAMLGLVATGYGLYIQVKKTGELEEKVQTERRETNRALDALKASQDGAKLWKELWEDTTGDLIDERNRAANLEKQRAADAKRWAALDAKLADYFSEIKNDPLHCDNQPVPAAVDQWMRELLLTDVPAGTSGH